MLVFDHNFTNDEVDALLPYLRTAKVSMAKEMTSEHIIARDKSALAYAALSRVLKPMEAHVLKVQRGVPAQRGVQTRPSRGRRG